jgi:hypothetical protein
MDTTAIDFLINNPPTPTLTSDTPFASEPSHISIILSNWPNVPSILPTHIPHDLTEPLLSSLANLSNFTVNQPERAWNLLNTYFQCRIREARMNVNGEVGLEVDDVEKAIGSARRMSVGHDMESVRKRKYSVGEEMGVRKWSIKEEIRAHARTENNETEFEGVAGGNRKWSVRNETMAEDEDDAQDNVKRQCLDDKDEQDVLSPLPLLPPLSALLNDEDAAPNQASSYPHRTLLPIAMAPLVRPLLTLDIPLNPAPCPYYTQATSVASYQAATHQANLCRQGLEAAEENLNAAKLRYADAQKKYGEAKRAAKRLRY